MKAKMFCGDGKDVAEKELNEFLKANYGIDIKFVVQSESRYTFTITIFYES